jgi:hypothetical protein
MNKVFLGLPDTKAVDCRADKSFLGRSAMIMFLAMSGISCLLAIGCLAMGMIVLIQQFQKDKSSLRALGVVVDLQKRLFNSESGGVYCPTVEFTTMSGETVRFESSLGTMPASHKIGQSVNVIYDQNDPHKAEVDSIAAKWLYPGCLLVFACGAFIFGILFFILYLVINQIG